MIGLQVEEKFPISYENSHVSWPSLVVRLVCVLWQGHQSKDLLETNRGFLVDQYLVISESLLYGIII